MAKFKSVNMWSNPPSPFLLWASALCEYEHPIGPRKTAQTWNWPWQKNNSEYYCHCIHLKNRWDMLMITYKAGLIKLSETKNSFTYTCMLYDQFWRDFWWHIIIVHIVAITISVCKYLPNTNLMNCLHIPMTSTKPLSSFAFLIQMQSHVFIKPDDHISGTEGYKCITYIHV